MVEKNREFIKTMSKMQKRMRSKIQTKNSKAEVIGNMWDLVQKELVDTLKK